jgi:hypothetical protein
MGRDPIPDEFESIQTPIHQESVGYHIREDTQFNGKIVHFWRFVRENLN